MRRYWIAPQNITSDAVVISGEDFHHICQVCRQGVGSKFEVLSEGSQALFVEITSVASKTAVAQILEKRDIAPLPRPHVHLALSVPRFSTADLIVEKMVELGVSDFRPFVSEFSFVRKPSKITGSKHERWERIVKNATQQTGRGELMKLHSPVSLGEMLQDFNRQTNVAGLFLYEGQASLELKAGLKGLGRQAVDDVWLFVGSEGGFSLAEVEKFRQAGLEPITLGQQVLRVETACLALVSVIKYEFDTFK